MWINWALAVYVRGTMVFVCTYFLPYSSQRNSFGTAFEEEIMCLKTDPEASKYNFFYSFRFPGPQLLRDLVACKKRYATTSLRADCPLVYP